MRALVVAERRARRSRGARRLRDRPRATRVEQRRQSLPACGPTEREQPERTVVSTGGGSGCETLDVDRVTDPAQLRRRAAGSSTRSTLRDDVDDTRRGDERAAAHASACTRARAAHAGLRTAGAASSANCGTMWTSTASAPRERCVQRRSNRHAAPELSRAPRTSARSRSPARRPSRRRARRRRARRPAPPARRRGRASARGRDDPDRAPA